MAKDFRKMARVREERHINRIAPTLAYFVLQMKNFHPVILSLSATEMPSAKFSINFNWNWHLCSDNTTK